MSAEEQQKIEDRLNSLCLDNCFRFETKSAYLANLNNLESEKEIKEKPDPIPNNITIITLPYEQRNRIYL